MEVQKCLGADPLDWKESAEEVWASDLNASWMPGCLWRVCGTSHFVKTLRWSQQCWRDYTVRLIWLGKTWRAGGCDLEEGRLLFTSCHILDEGLYTESLREFRPGTVSEWSDHKWRALSHARHWNKLIWCCFFLYDQRNIRQHLPNSQEDPNS